MYPTYASRIIAAWLLALLAALSLAPSRAVAAPADEQYSVAAGLYAKQQWQQAADEFQAYLAQFPTHEQADSSRYFYAESLVQLGKYAEARTGFAEFLAKHATHRLARQALFRSGEAAFLSGAGEEAQRDLDRFRKRYPQDGLNAYALGYLGEAYLTAGQAAEALAAYQECLRRFPEGPLAGECRFGLGKVHEQRQEFDAADKLYQQLADSRPSPLADNAQLQRGLMAYHRERYADAIAILKTFDADLADSKLRTHARYWLGMSQSAREDWKGATETLVLLSQDEPKHALSPAIEFAAGEALRKSGQPDDAMVHYDRVLSDWPRSEWADDSLQAKIQSALETGADLPLDDLATEFDDKFPESKLRPAVRLAVGRWHLKREEFAPAAESLSLYLIAQPDGADAAKCQAQLTAALAGAKRFDEASKSLDELTRRHPNDKLLPATTLHLADSALAAGENPLASRLYERLSKGGNSPETIATALAGLARAQARSGGGAKSAETLGKLVDEHPESSQAPEAAFLRARELDKLGKSQEALEAYQWLLEKFPTARQAPQAMLGAARLLEQLDQREAAAELLERLLKDYAGVPFIDAALYQYAWLLVDLKRDGEADVAFARLSKGHRESRYWADATFRVAERAAQSKDFDQASKLAGELLRSNCEGEILAHALYLQGQVAVAEQRWKDAPLPLLRVLDEFPTSEVALPAEYWIAECHYRLGEIDRADEEFARLAKKAEGRDEPWLAMIPLRQAQILGNRKAWAEAFDLASGIAERFPNFRQQYEVDYLLGRCLGSRGEFDAARAAYERVIRSPAGGRTETAAMAQWMIGESYFHQKNYDAAVKAYQRVERLFAFPRWQAGAVLQAGKCHEAKGEWKQAVQLYAQLLKDYPDTTFTEEASKRLRAAQDRATQPVAPRRN